MRRDPGSPSLPLHVRVVGQDPLARAHVTSRLSGDGTVELGGEERSHDVVVWDLGPDADRAPPTLDSLPPVVVLVADDIVGREVRHHGARGVLYRDATSAALMAAIHAVAGGLAVLETDVLLALAPPRDADDPPGGELTPREREVLGLLVEGASNRAIAARLSISAHTAKFHVNAVLSKLGVQRRGEAVSRALRLGLVTL